jgi:hypothetical protein
MPTINQKKYDFISKLSLLKITYLVLNGDSLALLQLDLVVVPLNVGFGDGDEPIMLINRW